MAVGTRASGAGPKKLTDALLSIADSGAANHPLLARVFLARQINMAHAGAVVSAWDIGELDDSTIDVFVGMVQDLPGMQQAEKNAQTRRAAWLAQHPTYRHFGLEVKH